MNENVHDANWKPLANPWVIAGSVALAAFMEVLDTSIANVALPHISGDLGASTDQGTWVLTSYLVTNAIVLPLGGWASSVLGRKNFFQICLAVFVLSSFLCGIAPTLPLLLFFRVLQGLGGGGLQPMAQAIMADSFDEKNRGKAFALYGIVAVMAPSIGPTLGGWVTDSYSWRWVFYINIPVGALAIYLVHRFVQDPPWIKPDRKKLLTLDYVGVGFLSLAMGGLQIMLDKGEENDWFGSNLIRLLGAMFVIGMIGLVWQELRAKNPVMNLRLFRFKNFTICVLLMSVVGGILNAGTVLEPQFLQGLLGYTSTNAGRALTIGGVLLLIVMPIAGIATGKTAARNLAAFGFFAFAGAFYFTAHHINLGLSFGYASWLRMLQMLPIPFAFVSITNAAYVGLPREESNQVAGLINFARNVGGSVLISLTGAEVINRGLIHQSRLQNSMLDGNMAFQRAVHQLADRFTGVYGVSNSMPMARGYIYQELNRQAAVMGYQDVYIVLAGMCLVTRASRVGSVKGKAWRSRRPRGRGSLDLQLENSSGAILFEPTSDFTTSLFCN